MIGRRAKTVLRHSRQRVRPSRKVCPYCFEADHLGGRNQIAHLTIDTCQVHHALLTEQRLVAGAEMRKQPNTTKTAEMAIRSIAVTGRAIASAMEKVCDGLEFCAEMLKRARR